MSEYYVLNILRFDLLQIFALDVHAYIAKVCYVFKIRMYEISGNQIHEYLISIKFYKHRLISPLLTTKFCDAMNSSLMYSTIVEQYH